jgi:predicted SAM-dependent methyltransferase
MKSSLQIIGKSLPFIEKATNRIKKNIKTQKSKSHIKTLVRTSEKILIELGAGNRPGNNGWTTIDLTEKCNIFWDLRYGIPFPDNSIDGIFSSHFFEHLSYRESKKLLEDCIRVLKPNGFFSITVPNARIYLDAYFSNTNLDESVFHRYRPAYNNATKIDIINYIAYMDNQHKYMFDEENLIDLLKTAGFREAQLREYDPFLDVMDRKPQSIFAIAYK